MSKNAKTVEEMFAKLEPRLMPPALHLKSPHIVGLFCPYSRSLLTLVWSTQAQQELAVLRDLKEQAHVLKSPLCTQRVPNVYLTCSHVLEGPKDTRSQKCPQVNVLGH